jgi:hypothetical protein
MPGGAGDEAREEERDVTVGDCTDCVLEIEDSFCSSSCCVGLGNWIVIFCGHAGVRVSVMVNKTAAIKMNKNKRINC